MDKFIKEIHDQMQDWFGFDLTEEQIIEYVEQSRIDCFDTVEREDFADHLAVKITGMNWPLNGDSSEYKKTFYQKLAANVVDHGISLELD